MQTAERLSSSNQLPPRRRRRGVRATIVAGVLAMGLGVGGIVWFLSGDAPDEVSITTAVDEAQSESDADAPAATTAATTVAEGTWTVDQSVGAFSVTDSTGVFVGVRVNEQLANIGATTAVVRTPGVSGSITLDGTTLTAADMTADFTALVSDESRRVNAVHRALKIAQYPAATFVLTQPVEVGTIPSDGTPVDVVATGELTVAGKTNTVEVPLQVAMTDGVAVVTGTFDVIFADYGVAVPTSPIVVSADDHGIVELQLFLTPAA